MFDYSPEQIITITRGDSFEIPLFINAGTLLDPIRFVLDDNCEIFFAVEEPNQLFENAIIRKRFDKNNLNENNDVLIKFDINDTENLLPGIYYYEIKLRMFDNQTNKYQVNTIVNKKKFIIQS